MPVCSLNAGGHFLLRSGTAGYFAETGLRNAFNFYNAGSSALARRVIEKTGCQAYEKDDDPVSRLICLAYANSLLCASSDAFLYSMIKSKSSGSVLLLTV